MNPTVSSIISNSRSLQDAWAQFAAAQNAGYNLDVNDFIRKASAKWPTSGNNTTTTSYTGGMTSGGFTSGTQSTGVISAFWEGLNKFMSGTASAIDRLYSTQLGQETSGQNFDAIQSLLKLVKNNGLNPLSLGKNLIGDTFTQVLDQLSQESKLLNDVNSKTTLTGELSKQVREEMLMSSIYAAKFGFSLSEVAELYTGMVEESGRFSLINKETMDMSAPYVRSLGTTMGDLARTISTFEKVGIGANDTIKKLSDAGIKSIGLGLNGKKTVSDIEKSIEKLNQYGFQNGIKGLENMVRKSMEFRMSLEETFNLAQKVMDPEGALDLSANLQVIGGAIGDLNDPIKMMYMATNNVEGLQDALIGAASGLATYNKEQGRFEITGLNIRRANEMAKQLGISYKDLTNGAIAAAERMSANTALLSRGLNINEDDRRFLTNLASMEGGEMVIKVPESISSKLGGVTKLALDKIDQNTVKTLLANREEFKKLSTEDIAMNQLTEIQQISRDVSVIAAYTKVRAVQLLGGVSAGVGLSDAIKNLRNSVKGQAGEIIEKNRTVQEGKALREKSQKTTENVIEKIKNPGETIMDGIKSGIDYLKEKFTSNETSRTLKVEFGPSPAIVDGLTRDMYRNPDKWKITENPREYLSSSPVVNV